MLILYWFFALFFIGVIKGIYDIYKSYQINKPDNNIIYHIPIEETKTDQNIDDEITHLEAQKEGYTSLYYQLEKQLETASNSRKISIEKQLLTLDNKIFTIDKRINKLMEKLD